MHEYTETLDTVHVFYHAELINANWNGEKEYPFAKVDNKIFGLRVGPFNTSKFITH